jgi:hypothetical protein
MGLSEKPGLVTSEEERRSNPGRRLCLDCFVVPPRNDGDFLVISD